jgi:3-deoxy-7-phosphoheptulonate synthase
MIVIIQKDAKPSSLKKLTDLLTASGVQVNVSAGKDCMVLGLVGDVCNVDADYVAAQEIVLRVERVCEPYKKANRKFHPNSTVVGVGGVEIGGDRLAVIAGPCSVESEDQILEVARKIKAAGANFLRGGAFKPRSSPYTFQGLKAEGLELLKLAKREVGLPIISEIMSPAHIELFEDVDIIQVGARNMQNFELLRELSRVKKPILLKRGLANTFEELLMSAEYLMSSGNDEIILCERGIRTFETYTRNTLDISAVPVLKHLSHLPVVVDPSHAAGLPWLVEPLVRAAVAVGADGLMIEVHNNPSKALSDGAQSITPQQFGDIMSRLRGFASCECRAI